MSFTSGAILFLVLGVLAVLFGVAGIGFLRMIIASYRKGQIQVGRFGTQIATRDGQPDRFWFSIIGGWVVGCTFLLLSAGGAGLLVILMRKAL